MYVLVCAGIIWLLKTSAIASKPTGVDGVPPRPLFKLSGEGVPAVMEMYRIWFQNATIKCTMKPAANKTMKYNKTTDYNCRRPTRDRPTTPSYNPPTCTRTSLPTFPTWTSMFGNSRSSSTLLPEHCSPEVNSKYTDHWRKNKPWHGLKVQSTSMSHHDKIGHRVKGDRLSTIKCRVTHDVKLCSCPCCSHKKLRNGDEK